MDEDIKQFFDGLTAEPEQEEQIASVEVDMTESTIETQSGDSFEQDDDVSDITPTSEEKTVFDYEEDGGEGQLTVDVYQTPKEIVVQSTIAGVDPENLEVSITNEMVTIRGGRVRSSDVNLKDYLFQELYWGRFSRSVILPQEIDSEKAVAELKNGILTIQLPKTKKQKVKKLKINTA